MNDNLALYIILTIVVIFVLGVIGNILWENEVIQGLWTDGNVFGKAVTCMIAVLAAPFLIVYGVFMFFRVWGDKVKDFLFPRESGKNYRVKYTPELKKMLEDNHIIFGWWGQICPESSIIVFFWIKDYEKACKANGAVIPLVEE